EIYALPVHDALPICAGHAPALLERVRIFHQERTVDRRREARSRRMSAQPANPNVPPDHVTIDIDGQSMVVPKGSMIIAAADKAGIALPRFCYHEKLTIAANCRM